MSNFFLENVILELKRGNECTFTLLYGLKCTSVTGHIFSRDFHPDYQDWKRDPIELFDAPTIKKENNVDLNWI